MEGIKHDKDKPKIHLLTTEGIFAVADVLTWGANKYGTYNFHNGIHYTRLIDAAIRHLLKFANGCDTDPESNKSHVAHAGANIMMLLWMIENKPEMDDRPKKEVEHELQVCDNRCNYLVDYGLGTIDDCSRACSKPKK